jgi:hypothetical protein
MDLSRARQLDQRPALLQPVLDRTSPGPSDQARRWQRSRRRPLQRPSLLARASGDREPGRVRTRRSAVKFLVTAPVGVLVLLLTVSACGSADSLDVGSPVPAAASSAPAASHCAPRTGFALSLVSNRHGQRTPLAAAIWFSAHGGVPAIPHNGWRVTSRSDVGATVESGSVTVHVMQGPDKTWQVDSGERCS